jgi:ethanolamine ammonia-lyase small subunit
MNLRDYTPARVGLGRTGNAPTLRETLDFQLAHARARDAVHAPFNAPALAAELDGVVVHSAARDRREYLTRPDLGRRLAADVQLLPTGAELVVILADGLSPVATERHGPALYRTLLTRLEGWSVARPVIAVNSRVALSDEIGERLKAKAALILIGERPGLTSPDSLGAYLTWNPRVGRTDAERNCVSNIRPEGLQTGPAAELLALLLNSARQQGVSGVALSHALTLSP